MLESENTERKPAMRHEMKHFEMHIMHSCNLSCEYCVHYCNYGYTGTVPFSEGKKWISDWSERLSPKLFRILGGEPLLHKEVASYIFHCAESFPGTDIDLVTNGLLLRKREEVLPALLETNVKLTSSLHPLRNKRQEALINDALTLAYQFQKKGLRLHVSQNQAGWLKLYQGDGKNIPPFNDNRPDKSNKCCMCFECKTLHQGKLWKCPPLAYLPMVIEKLDTRSA